MRRPLIIALAAFAAVPTLGSAAVIARDGDVSDSSSVWVSGGWSKKFQPTASLVVQFTATQVYRERVGSDENYNAVYAPEVTRPIAGKGTVTVECGGYANTIIGPWWQDRITRKRLIRTGTTKFALPPTRPGERCQVSWSTEASDYTGAGDVVSTTGLLTVSTAGRKRT